MPKSTEDRTHQSYITIKDEGGKTENIIKIRQYRSEHNKQTKWQLWTVSNKQTLQISKGSSK